MLNLNSIVKLKLNPLFLKHDKIFLGRQVHLLLKINSEMLIDHCFRRLYFQIFFLTYSLIILIW